MAHEANGYHVGQLGSRNSQMRERNTGAHNSYLYKVLLEVQETASVAGVMEKTPRGEEVAWK